MLVLNENPRHPQVPPDGGLREGRFSGLAITTEEGNLCNDFSHQVARMRHALKPDFHHLIGIGLRRITLGRRNESFYVGVTNPTSLTM
jgi:hypothetical protein